MGTGMKKRKKTIGIGLGICLGLSPLRAYAGETDGMMSVAEAGEMESAEKVSPTAEAIMKKFMGLEGEETEAGEGGKAAGLADGVPLELADGDVDINEVNFPDTLFRDDIVHYYDGSDGSNRDGKLSESELAQITTIAIDREDQTQQYNQYHQYQDLTGIEYFTSLTYLHCRCNQLTHLDVSKNTSLTYLNCTANQLTDLDVSQNEALKGLECAANSLGSLDISQNTALEFLWCPANQLDSLNISQNTMLTSLTCHKNQLTSLDTSENTMLTKLSCYSNQLTSLDVSENTMLTDLWCSSNQLTSLDVSRNAALEVLECGSNRLANLDISRNTALMGLSCSSNQLTSLDVSRNIGLTALECANNRLSCLDLSNTDLEADDAVIDIGNQMIEIDGSSINILVYDSNFDVGRVSALNGLVLKDGVFTLADGVKSGSYVYNVKLPSGNSIPMEVTIRMAGNSGDEEGERPNEGDANYDESGSGEVESDGGSHQEDNGEETTALKFKNAMWSRSSSVRGRRVQTSGGKYVASSIDGIYNANSIRNMAIVTPKESVAEAVGIPVTDMSNGTNLSLQVEDCRVIKKQEALKSIADGMGKKVMAYIDVDLYSINRQGKVNTIRTASQPVTMMFGVPETYVSPAHSYSVICVDENGNTVVFQDTDTDDRTITIDANVFGTYIIVYEKE